MLLCIQTGATRDEPNRLRFEAEEFYLKTAAEMRRSSPPTSTPVRATTPCWWRSGRRSISSSAGSCSPVRSPAGRTESSYLRQLVISGAVDRYGDPLPESR